MKKITLILLALLLPINAHSLVTSFPVKINNFTRLKDNNGLFETEPFFLLQGSYYKFKLSFRPNGLKYTDSFNKGMEIWLQPMAGDHDENLAWPVKVKITINLGNIYEQKTKDCKSVGILTKWDKGDTHTRYATAASDSYLQHSDINQYLEHDDSLTLTISIETLDNQLSGFHALSLSEHENHQRGASHGACNY